MNGENRINCNQKQKYLMNQTNFKKKKQNILSKSNHIDQNIKMLSRYQKFQLINLKILNKYNHFEAKTQKCLINTIILKQKHKNT